MVVLFVSSRSGETGGDKAPAAKGGGEAGGHQSPAAHLPVLRLLRRWCEEFVLVVCYGAVWGRYGRQTVGWLWGVSASL